LFELEKQQQKDTYELTTCLLFETELRHKSGYLPALQPSIEIYICEGFVGIRSSMMEGHRYQDKKQLKCKLAFIACLTATPETAH
jgi:hypothetical protein